MKTGAIILGLAGIGLAYLYFTSKKGYSQDKPSDNPSKGRIIFTETTDTTQTQVASQDSIPQPPDINIILPKGN
jgi:hypothetical protein